ncbi:WecB/TagA/CpsF family glycosyltransferase [uncultured Sunxiuqinia sp.]|uniref:WecB/TagA/CpsF family glycosyltransferase n=1 Tax=uncultured Sunxiuqinia sp. TaxID=1573825 RepID=UPI002632098F|nr:WecB/TagA/CpsF family glycosyltransferase [uncultured Sunxiuqinia sp.]
MKTASFPLLGYPVYCQDLSAMPQNQKLIINTLNGHSYTVAKKDKIFSHALRTSDILLPDGISVVMGAKILEGKRIKKIAGYDVFLHLLHLLEQQNGSCFFLGAMPDTLKRIKEKLETEFPHVRVGSFSPPYKPVFSEEDSRLMCEQVNLFCPDVLFVGMTAPKQEKWVHENKEKLDARITCSIGAVFDFYAGTSERPPKWMIDMKLEWLGRLLKEPKRMWRRYLLSTPVFFIDVFRHKYGLAKNGEQSQLQNYTPNRPA